MSIERVEEKWGDRFCEYRSDTMNMIYFSILKILKEEAEPPCKRCELWINEKCREYDCMYNSVQSKHSFFEPKEDEK